MEIELSSYHDGGNLPPLPGEGDLDRMERQPLVLTANDSAPGRLGELPLSAVTRVMQHLDVPQLRSMALSQSRWRDVLRVPAVWLAAGQRTGAVQLLRAKDRLALSRDWNVPRQEWARRAAIGLIGAPFCASWVFAGVINLRNSSTFSKAFGAGLLAGAPLIGLHLGTRLVCLATPVFNCLRRAADQRDEVEDLQTRRREFGHACAREVLAPVPSDPAVQQAAVSSLKRGLLQHSTDGTTVVAAFVQAVAKKNIAHIEAILGADIARVASDLQAAPEACRSLLMLLVEAERPDLIVSLARLGLKLDGMMHGEVSIQSLLASRLRRHLQDGNIEQVDRYIAVLPQADTDGLTWTSQAMQENAPATDLAEFPALQERLNSAVDAARIQGDIDAATTLAAMGATHSANADPALDQLMLQAAQSQDWTQVAVLREKLAVNTDRLAVKLDMELYRAIAGRDGATVSVLRRAGALARLVDERYGTHLEFARSMNDPTLVAALTE